MLCIFIMICVCTNHIIFIAIAYYCMKLLTYPKQQQKNEIIMKEILCLLFIFLGLLSLKGTQKIKQKIISHN